MEKPQDGPSEANQPELTADIAGSDRIVMLVKNSFEYDARIRKEATSLLGDGWQVNVVAMHAPGVTSRSETTPEGIGVVRVDRLYGRAARLGGPSTTMAGVAGAPWRPYRLLRPLLRVVGPVLRAANTVVVDRRMVAAAVALAPRVVHAHDLNTLAAGRRAARQAGAKLVYDAHELHRARNGMSARGRARARRRERRLIRHADLVITATGTWADLLAEDVDGVRPLVLRNLPEGSAAAVPLYDLRARLGLAGHERLLVYQGSIQKGRGIEATIAALSELTDCHLAVIGYGAHRPALKTLARQLRVADRVHFTGPVPNHDLVAWTRTCDVGICLIEDTSLSYRTSLPNKLFEYLHAGVPVIASDFPEMGKVIRDTGAGEVCDPADAASVVRTVRGVLADRERYAKAAKAAVGAYVWEREAAGLTSAYDKLEARGR